jgi:hypothetical protein
MCLKQMDWLKSELAWYPWDAGAVKGPILVPVESGKITVVWG